MTKLKLPGVSFVVALLLVAPGLPAAAKGGNKHLCLPAKHKTCKLVSFDGDLLTFAPGSHVSDPSDDSVSESALETGDETAPQTGTATLPVSEDVVVKLYRGKGPKHLEQGKQEAARQGKSNKPAKTKNGHGKHGDHRHPTRGSVEDLQPGVTILKLKVRNGVIERIYLRVPRVDDGEDDVEQGAEDGVDDDGAPEDVEDPEGEEVEPVG